MKSIKWKLVAIYLALVFIVLIMSGTFIILRLQRDEESKLANELSTISSMVKEQIVAAYKEPDNFQKALSDIYGKYIDKKFEVAILDHKGSTLASSKVQADTLLKNMPKYSDSTIVAALNGDSNTFNISEIENTESSFGLELSEYINFSQSLKDEGEVRYVIYTRTNAKEIRGSIKLTTQTLLVTLVFALLFTMVVGYFFASSLTEPIAVLTAKTKEFASAKEYVQIEAQSNDEIGQLTMSFNQMSKELNETLNQISYEKNKLEVILDNMTDGVLAFDAEGALTHQNQASFDILDLDSTELNLESFVKKFNIEKELLKEEDDINDIKEITFVVADRYIKTGVAEYQNEFEEKEGTVFVLQDITKQKRLDDMRKDFVANVSHELRTPLTTVKSYAETLIDGAVEDRDTAYRFLETIDEESDRMTNLVQDLLQLSRYDNQQYQFDIKKIYLNNFLQEIVSRNKIYIDGKKQKVVLEKIDNEDFILADEDRITQVVNNIVMNAVKYCPTGSTIKIYKEEDEKVTKIIVEDDGNGISKDDLKKIFERFYRVDKTGSRQMGGTGLGLPIAKEIMEAHGGKIIAESKIAEGTKMIMVLKRENKL